MSLNRAIGGFFELELPCVKKHFHSNSTYLNSGRSCFAYSLIEAKCKKVYIPYYISDSIIEPLDVYQIEYQFYHINTHLELVETLTLEHNEMLLYVNYFGQKGEYLRFLSEKYSSNLIVDNTQAFYDSPLPGSYVFYSPRKFFGVPDGGYLYRSEGFSKKNTVEIAQGEALYGEHLIGRLVCGPGAYYKNYTDNEKQMAFSEIKKMSCLSERILSSIDYEYVRRVREQNYLHLHKALGGLNHFPIKLDHVDGPFCYPLMLTHPGLYDLLIKNMIFVPSLWIDALHHRGISTEEKSLIEDIIPLPIDQRYSSKDMDRIIDIIYMGMA